jgi:hypothetical protein
MTQRTAAELYRALRGAGFSVASAVTMTAIGLAESGGNDTAQGDMGLQTTTWGPSVGVWQVRTLKSQTGTGQDRDLAALNGNLDRQAKAAYAISSGGTNLSPWSVFTSGKYQQFLSQAEAAGIESGIGLAGDESGIEFAGLGELVPDVPGAVKKYVGDTISTVLGDAITATVKPFKNTITLTAFVVLGAGLLAFGVARTFSPTTARARRAVTETVRSTVHTAGKVAAVAA